MAKTGLKQKSKNAAMDLAVREFYVAIDHFGQAMEDADISYMAASCKPYPFTLNMEEAFTRYIIACRRLKELNGQKS